MHIMKIAEGMQLVDLLMSLIGNYSKEKDKNIFNLAVSNNTFAKIFSTLSEEFGVELKSKNVNSVEELKQVVSEQTAETHHSEFVSRTVERVIRERAKSAPESNFNWFVYVKPVIDICKEFFQRDGVLSTLLQTIQGFLKK